MAEPRKPVPLGARDKLTFLLALVPFLADRGGAGATVAETAEHFEVSPEQIREAVRLLTVSGVPGETSTYQYEDLFDIDWDAFELHDEIVLTNRVAIDDSPRLSAREAAALIAGLQYLSSLPENADRQALGSLIAKLSHGASSAPSPVAVADRETDATVAAIRDSVAAGVQLDIDYRGSRGELERRMVDPLRIESVDADWYLRGWCHLREAVRTFRLDRITRLEVTDVPVSHSVDSVALPDTLFQGSDDDLLVTIDVAASAEALLTDYIPDGATREERDGRIRTTLRVSHYHGLKRLIGSMPGVAEVVAPEQARIAVAEWAAEAAARYES